MKNLKKVLALAVAFVMCFTMFAGAAVYSDVPAGSDYSEAVSLLSDLGIIAGMPDGSFGVDKTITRADAACLIARMLTGETMPSKYAGASNFVDVPKSAYYESAVAYCAIMGITSGTSATAGTYSPSREITDGEFIAMITRALGYDSAANPLQFPMGNVARAQQEGILDGVNVDVNSPALRGEDAMMIYNALFADYDWFAKKENIYQGADDVHNFASGAEYTIAHEVFNLDRLAIATNGTVDYKEPLDKANLKCAAHQWVVVGVDPREKANMYTAFPIDDKDLDLDLNTFLRRNGVGGLQFDGDHQAVTFEYEGDADSILGYAVELWGDLDHTGTEHDIVAVKTLKNQTAYDWNISMGEDGADELQVASDKTVDAEDAMMVIGTTLEDEDKDLIVGVHIDPASDLDAYQLVDFDEFNDKQWKNKDGDSYRLFDWDSDGKIDVVLRTIRKYAEITDIDSKDVAFQSILDGEEIDVNCEIDGDRLKVACEGIAEGDVVEMTYTRAYSASEKGEVVSVAMKKVDSDVKQLTKVSTKGDLEMTFDGDVYKYADDKEAWDYVEDEDNKRIENDLEGNYEIWLDANGYIVKLEESDSNTGYLVVLELDDGDRVLSKGRSTRASMRVKLDDNTVDVYDVAYDLEIVGTVADLKGTVANAGKLATVRAANNNEKEIDIQNIVSGQTLDKTGAATAKDEIDGSTVRTKRNINRNGEYYNKDQYSWTNENRMVGQVYKYWMDSDKVITKLERAAETVDYYEQYYSNTGVVRVSGGEVKKLNATATGVETDWTKRTYLGREFNGNVYLKNAKVLFITDDDFVSNGDYLGQKHIAADPDKVLAIEPTTANLRAISIAAGEGNNLADRAHNGTHVDDVSARNNSYSWTGVASWLNGNRALYHGNSVVGAGYRVADDGTGSVKPIISGGPDVGNQKSAQIAYDIDDNNYATAALMKISNFDSFDKRVSVALITDVAAQNRKNTVFTIDGALGGEVGSFVTVEAEDGASEIFHHWELNNAGVYDAIPYDDLSDVRDDIDDNAVYAEITQDTDGKITKVVVMDGEDGRPGILFGEKRMVVRLVLGNKAEIDGSTVSFASHAGDNNNLSGTNIMAYADEENLYVMSNISWHNSFDLTGSTQHYMITNKLKDVVGMDDGAMLQVHYDGNGHPSNGFTDEPKIKKSDAASITATRTSLQSSIDKYAIADVAFDRENISSNQLDSLSGDDARAVFSYEKRFGQANLQAKRPSIAVVESEDTVLAAGGAQQVSRITFTGAYTGTSSYDATLRVGDVDVKFTIENGVTAAGLAASVEDALRNTKKISDDFQIASAGATVTLTSRNNIAHRKVSFVESIFSNIKEDGVAGAPLNGLTFAITSVVPGRADSDETVPASLSLRFTGGSGVPADQRRSDLAIYYNDGADVTVDNTTVIPAPATPVNNRIEIGEFASAEEIANLAKDLIEARLNVLGKADDWDIDVNGDTLILTQVMDENAPIAITWGIAGEPLPYATSRDLLSDNQKAALNPPAPPAP